MVEQMASEVALEQEVLAEEAHPEAPVLVVQEDQQVAAVAVLVVALEVVQAPGQEPPEAFYHHAWMMVSPSRATGLPTS